MSVTTLRTERPADRTLECPSPVWVPVRGTDGRTRMEMRWTDPRRRTVRRGHAA